MRRFLSLLILAFNRKGFMAFIVYYVLFFISIYNIFPLSWLQEGAVLLSPYYGAVRLMGLLANILVCVMTVHFLIKFMRYEAYPIKRKTLSFVIALCFIQLLSFYCSMHIPVSAITVTAQLESLQAVFEAYQLYVVELVALCLSGYVLAFYIGVLSRAEFAMDVIVAPKKPEK